MYCPQCGQEFAEGVTRCGDCGVALTVDPPASHHEPPAEWLDLVTVLETSDPALLAVARSLLEAEGIPALSRGDLLQDLLGWGRLGSGYNVVAGPVQLQVPRDRGDEARALLAAVNPAAARDEPAPPDADSS